MSAGIIITFKFSFVLKNFKTILFDVSSDILISNTILLSLSVLKQFKYPCTSYKNSFIVVVVNPPIRAKYVPLNQLLLNLIPSVCTATTMVNNSSLEYPSIVPLPHA